jgi:membrane-associated phospholipid phosphatase
MDFLIHIDHWLFDAINQGMSNALLDAVLPFFREKYFWAPFYLFVIAYILLNFSSKNALKLLFGLALTVTLADTTSSVLIKKNVQRIRPCNDLNFSTHIIERVPCGAGYSFTSSHACNHFAVAVFLMGVFGHFGRWVRPILLLWAGLIAFAQVYVGVHYPLDVSIGALIGIGIGWFIQSKFDVISLILSAT